MAAPQATPNHGAFAPAVTARQNLEPTPMRRSRLLLTALSAALLVVAGPASAQDKKAVELRYTSGAPPKGNPWVMQIERFAKNVDEESKGELKIAPFFASQPGSEQDTVQQVARGRIDMGGFSNNAVALLAQPDIDGGLIGGAALKAADFVAICRAAS